jgi:uncharacterized protein with GYD domain
MQRYVVLYKLTDQAAKDIKTSVREQGDACDKALDALGCRALGAYGTMGEYDGVAIIEAPSEKAMFSYLLDVASQGHMRTTTLRAFPWGEYLDTIDQLP